MPRERTLSRLAIALGFGLALALVTPLSAVALDLDSARAQGLVGEQTDGYVGAVQPGASAEVDRLVAEVNAKRRAAYEDIARKNGTAVTAVAALAGQRLLERAPPGAWIGDGTGHWYQKK
jgi:uncharacterized protein YdbL (DUF1318 family)